MNNNQKVYGIVTGSVIGDVMGSLALVNNQINEDRIKSPLDAEKIHYPIGLWSDYSAYFLTLLSTLNQSATAQQLTLQHLKQFGIGTIGGNYQHDFEPEALTTVGLQLLKYEFDQSLINVMKKTNNDHMCKIWTAILDFALHGLEKKQILMPVSYANLELNLDLMDLFQPVDIYQLSDCHYLKCVLSVFREACCFREGMLIICNYCSDPLVPAILYGQLAGLHYGLTDIPEYWIEALQNRRYIGQCITEGIKSLENITVDFGKN